LIGSALSDGGIIMRRVVFNWALAAGVIGVCGMVAVVGASAWAATPGGDGVVRLDGPAALAELRAKNPTHYALATRIMAEANHLCKSVAGQLQHTQPDDASCTGVLLSTSNPPKRQITFRLDQTVYIATVTVTDDPPRLVAASSGR
jgi:hypothetical protein